MIFSWIFLVVLTVLGALVWLLPKKAQSIINIVSIGMIGYWHWQSAIILIVSTYLTYLSYKKGNLKAKNALIVLHLLALLLMGTQNSWFSEEINTLTFLGLSYFSLQNISLLRLKTSSEKLSFQDLLLANSFFPKAIAGPILRAKESTVFTSRHKNSSTLLAKGVQRILFGLMKKLVLADRLAIITDNLFFNANGTESPFSIIVGSILFTLQMYLDFSAYSDIAIGSANVMGYELKENFNIPLRSKSIAEYWRKTHISLIDWLTTHLYYPVLYHFRKYKYFSVVVAIFVTFSLSGLWHGRHLGYIIWGILNASYLILEFLVRNKKKKKSKHLPLFGVLYTLFFVSISNFFFKAKSWENIKSIYLGIKDKPFLPKDFMADFVAIMGNGGHFLQQYNLIETAALLFLFFLFERKIQEHSRSHQISLSFVVLMLFCIAFLGNFNAGQEFIYVQF